VDFVFQKILSD